MENKKLIKILTKDMSELEELIGEMKSKQKFDVLEMEFIHTRAKGVMQLLQLLNSREEPLVPVSGEEDKILEKLKDKVEKVSQITSEIKPETDEPEKPVKETGQEPPEQPLPGVIPEPSEPETEDDSEPSGPQQEDDSKLSEPESEDNPEPDIEEEKVSSKQEEQDEDMLQEEIRRPDTGGRLGDSFLKRSSVNDLITDQVKLEYKLSNRPVSSIQSAIGINDRFQYIRELFDGDNRKFLETVKVLDSMDNIRQAVDYLRAHYKWKKNETSLKFVNLVKRRFQDSAAG